MGSLLSDSLLTVETSIPLKLHGHSSGKTLQREFEDLKHDKIITTQQFKQRVAQILHSYSLKGPGEQYSYLEKLVRGMPARLLKCKKNKYGPCGQQVCKELVLKRKIKKLNAPVTNRTGFRPNFLRNPVPTRLLQKVWDIW